MQEDLGVAFVIKPSQGTTLVLTPGHSGATAELHEHPPGQHKIVTQVSNVRQSTVYLGALKAAFNHIKE